MLEYEKYGKVKGKEKESEYDDLLLKK